MIEQALTTECCEDIVAFVLKKRGWTIARMARVTGTPVNYIQRIQFGKQSFQLRDVEAIAEACGTSAHRLILESIPETDGKDSLRNFALEGLAIHEALGKAVRPKNVKKKRPRTSAA